MINSMPRRIEAGSKWIVLPMSWVKSWQDYIYFDLIMGTTENKPDWDAEIPEAIEWTEIVKPINSRETL